MARSDVKVTSERNPSSRDPEKRSYQFSSVLLAGLVAVPALGLVCRFIVFCAPELLWLVALCAVLTGVALSAAAVAIGIRVAKRNTLVVAHVAATNFAFGLAVYVTTTVRWPERSEPWYIRLLAVVNWPAWWVILHLFGSIIVAGSWLLYRLDGYRASTGESSEDSGGLAKLLRWPKGAKVRADTIESDDFAVTATIDHPNVPIAEVRGALPALEETPGIIRGRSSIVGSDHGGSSTIRYVHTDPHSEWKKWPGLSHPGGFYHDPIRTSYYSTGQEQWYSFAKTPDGYRSKRVPNFVSPNGSFKGAQGMTSSGKSGDAALECAEVLSRVRTVLIYIDPAKLMQNMAWGIGFCALAAGSPATSGALFSALQRMGEYRERVLSHHGIRDFNDDAAIKTGLPWVHVFADEFDVAKQNSAMTWLATKGRSLGFRFSFALPRGTGENIDTNIRASVGMWAQFGISQDYDASFVISRETLDAGANPEQFGATVPGVHYLDKAPGVDKKLWPLDCRSYQTAEDFSDLQAAVSIIRAEMEAAGTLGKLTAGELEALGEIAQICSPDSVRRSRSMDPSDQAPVPVEAYAPPATPIAEPTRRSAPAPLMDEEEDVRDTLSLDPATKALLDGLPDTDVSDLEAEFGKLDPRAPLPETIPDTFEMASSKPEVPPAETVAEMDAAIIRMDRRGVQEFTNADLRDEMRVAMRPSAMSNRFTAIQNDETLNPPGLKIERMERGHYGIIRLSNHSE